MNNDTLARLMHATELTRSGRLAEATALIQRTLAVASPDGAPAQDEEPPRDRAGDVIEGECVEVSAAKAVDAVAVDAVAVDAVAVDAVDAAEAAKRAAASAQPAAMTPGRGLKDLLRSLGTRSRLLDPIAPIEPTADEQAPGQFVAGLYANAAGERAYKLYIPSNHAGQALPLIVMLHGCTQSPDDFAAGTQMNRLAEEARCFVLYPAQANAANHSRCWNWFRREDQGRDRGEPSIIAGMTRDIVTRHGVDARRVYIAGLSAGGAMAAVMAVTYPELYSAAGIHSGLACGAAHDLPSALAAMKGMPGSSGRPATGAMHATPTIVFHGDHDKTVHPRNGAEVIARSTHAGGQGDSERAQSPNGHAYTRTVHRNAEGRVLLEHWLVHGGGHAWFGGSRAGSYTDAKGPDASAEMLRFFLKTA